MKENICVIGVGALGQRHLESLLDLQEDYNLFGLETNQERINVLKEEFKDSICLVDEIESLPKQIKLCVIATNSNVRRKVFASLVNHADVDNIIFEKVLFQKKEDYEFVLDEIAKRNIKAWVNCARREWDFYKSLKKHIETMNSFTLQVSGGEWGLCCNGIHFLDLIKYLSGDDEVYIDGLHDEGIISESKRPGFYEIYGAITGHTEKCKSFQISCLKDDYIPISIMIASDDFRALIDESKRQIRISEKDNNWDWREESFELPYQSQLTAKEAEHIFNNCSTLPTFEESMVTHLAYIEALQEVFVKNGWEDADLCPIT